MGDKNFLDISTIAGGGIVSYASFVGEAESLLGLGLVISTLLLTLLRIIIALREWQKQ